MAAAKHAIVGVIEDLHWSDSGTLAVLALLAERLAATRMLLVVTYRANELGPDHPHYVPFGALQRSRSVANIALTPLAAEDLRDFIDATLRKAPGDVPLDLRREVAHVAEGNPFFTEELLKEVVDRGQHAQTGRSLPTTIQAAIMERMLPLATTDRTILTHSAVIGRRFEVDLLAHMLDTDVAAILLTLQRARALQIVEETTEPTTFRFRHALTREAIYDQLLTAQRQPLHRRIALVLEVQTVGKSSPDALAYHWWAAGDRDKALEYGERGGDAAQALHSHADAIACYDRTLNLLEPRDRDAARVRAKMGLSYSRSGFPDRAIEHFQAAWAFYETTTDDAPFIFRLARFFAGAMYNDGRPRESIAFLRRAVDVVSGCGDRRISDRARLTLASYLVDFGEIDETRAVLCSIDAELIGDDSALTILFWQTTCRVCELQGDVVGFLEATEHLCAIRELPADAIVMIDCLREAGISALNIGATTVARRCLGRAIDTCVALKWTATAHGDLLLASALERVLSGAFEEARLLVVQALPMIGEVKISRHAAAVAALAVGTALDDRELLAHVPDAAFIDRAFETDLPFIYGPLAALCGQLLAARGERDSAGRLLRRAVRLATAALPLYGSFPLVIVAAMQCDRADADGVRELCARSLQSGPAPEASAELGAAILLHRFGDAASAIAPAQRAAAGFVAIGWPVYEALAREVAGDDRSARRIRERIGYRGKMALQPRSANDSMEPALTPREREVARLVADGGTNRAIATALSVSVSLVEKHLSSIYGKLAITSRSQLTAYLVARDAERRRQTG